MLAIVPKPTGSCRVDVRGDRLGKAGPAGAEQRARPNHHRLIVVDKVGLDACVKFVTGFHGTRSLFGVGFLRGISSKVAVPRRVSHTLYPIATVPCTRIDEIVSNDGHGKCSAVDAVLSRALSGTHDHRGVSKSDRYRGMSHRFVLERVASDLRPVSTSPVWVITPYETRDDLSPARTTAEGYRNTD